MLLAIVNAIFATLFWRFALSSLRRGRAFVRTGWLAIDASVAQPGFRQDINRRRTIDEGGRFLLGGLTWLVLGLGAVVIGALFAIEAARFGLAAFR
jgi:hypothetical protein